MRSLPWSLEALVYSFLSIDDLPTFLFTAKATAGAVVRYFQTAKQLVSLRTAANLLEDVFRFPEEVRGVIIQLAVKHCQQLHEIKDIALDSQGSQLIINNRAWLRVVQPTQHTAELAQCPKLETVELSEVHLAMITSQLALDAAQGLRQTLWPNLSSLSLRLDEGHHSEGTEKSLVDLFQQRKFELLASSLALTMFVQHSISRS